MVGLGREIPEIVSGHEDVLSNVVLVDGGVVLRTLFVALREWLAWLEEGWCFKEGIDGFDVVWRKERDEGFDSFGDCEDWEMNKEEEILGLVVEEAMDN